MYPLMKRILDVAVAVPLLMLFLPFGCIIALILRFTGEGEIFFSQERVGLDNKRFKIYKFATMLKNSPASGSITHKNDPRILPLGKFLRTTKINELPQLLNILNGTMSLVGPRPLHPEGFQLYPEKVKKVIFKDVKPGLTGIGSVAFRDEENLLSQSEKDLVSAYKDEVMVLKGALELWYRNNRSMRTDCIIIFLTALAIIFPKNNLYKTTFKNLPGTKLNA